MLSNRDFDENFPHDMLDYYTDIIDVVAQSTRMLLRLRRVFNAAEKVSLY